MSAAENIPPAVKAPQWRLKTWFPDLTPKLEEGLKLFHEELLRFNQKINLISRKTELEADDIHFADSILGAKLLLGASKAHVIYDIGSGNGFPGVVIALLDPSRQVVLVDKDTRKIEFLKHVIANLGLKNVRIQQTGLEELAENSVECAVSRGFATISKILLASRKILRSGAEYYHFKGSGWATEVTDIPSQICSHWQPKLVGEYTLPSSKAKLVVVLTRRRS